MAILFLPRRGGVARRGPDVGSFAAACPHKERERAGVRVRRAAIKRFFDGVMAAWQGARAQTKLGIEKIAGPSDCNTLGSLCVKSQPVRGPDGVDREFVVLLRRNYPTMKDAAGGL